MLNGFGWPHLLIIAVLIILLFGAKRLPDAARGIGKSMRIFKAETRGLQDDDAAAAASPAPQATPQQQLAPPQQQYTSAPFATPTAAEQGNGPTDQQR
ncbi:MAG TPA: Sec-independent protein translocase subunit TatA [Pseudonocardiaceae bacterium]